MNYSCFCLFGNVIISPSLLNNLLDIGYMNGILFSFLAHSHLFSFFLASKIGNEKFADHLIEDFYIKNFFLLFLILRVLVGNVIRLHCAPLMFSLQGGCWISSALCLCLTKLAKVLGILYSSSASLPIPDHLTKPKRWGGWCCIAPLVSKVFSMIVPHLRHADFCFCILSFDHSCLIIHYLLFCLFFFIFHAP